MNIATAIRKARILRDTEIPDSTMVGWLSAHDGAVWQEVVSRYEGPPTVMPVYGDDTDLEATELLIQAPWDELYPHYLAARIDLAHQDIDRYNNEAMVYEQQRRAWANEFNRKHRWAGTGQLRELRPKYYDTQILF